MVLLRIDRNLLEFLEYVCDYIDKGLPVDVIYLDFKKAFDKVLHNRWLRLTLWTPDVFSQTSPWRQTFFRVRKTSRPLASFHTSN